LLDAGFDLEAVTTSGVNPMAFQKQFLRPGDNMHGLQPGVTPLMKAADKGHHLCVARLLRAGADKNAVNSMNADIGWMTPLLYAVQSGHLKCVKELVNAGVDLEVKTQQNMTALLCAAQLGHHQMMSLLLDGGANRKAKATGGNTALHQAAMSGMLNNMAIVYRKQGKYDEALRLYTECLVIRKKALGDEHIEVAETLHNIALVRKQLDHHDDDVYCCWMQ
jgi:ankyrin repeat protein